jgi:Raf kinase inhibitor-like YbhB/YbcL family protein
MLRAVLASSAAACALGALPAAAQQSAESNEVEIVGHVLEPAPLEPSAERVGQLQLPDGFEIASFAEGLVNPRMLAVADDGTVYVTQRSVGNVVMLRDEDGDGRADLQEQVASRPDMHGIAIDGRRMYLTTIKDVYRAEIEEDGTLGQLERIIDDLPDAGQHPNRTIAIGPDGKLYISVGSTCNACGEANPESATLLRAEPDGSSRRIFASGLRNTIGFDWQPETGLLYGLDHGIDWLGDQEQQEELNRLEQGKKYGWPYIYADGKHNPADEPPGGISMEEWARTSEEPVLMYTPHAAPMQMAFYRGGPFPEEYLGDAFAAMRGSWNRKPPSGYEVVRIRFENGEPRAIEPFVTGFLVDQESGEAGQFARLAGLAITRDGALLVSDDSNGVIYRISYARSGDQQAADAALPMARPAQPSAAASSKAGAAASGEPGAQQLALSMVDAAADARLEVDSPAFEGNQSIPVVYSEYGEGISPPLSWSAGPEGTQSYVLLLEDPDAAEPKPFVHWIMYNLPAEVRSLREGIPGAPRLELPDGVMQGQNSRGSTGYFGMKPPAGPAHRYHFQVLALDQALDLPAGAGREAVLDAIKGHVLAEGELVGSFQKP